MALREQGLVVLHAPLGHTKLTVSTTAVSLPNLPPVDRIRRVVIRTLSAGIVWKDDGADPAGNDGMSLQTNETLVYDGTRPDQIRLIRDGSATQDADVRVAYHGI